MAEGLFFAGWSNLCAHLSTLSYLLGKAVFITIIYPDGGRTAAAVKSRAWENKSFFYFYVSIYIKHNYRTYQEDLWVLFFAFMRVFNMGKA